MTKEDEDWAKVREMVRDSWKPPPQAARELWQSNPGWQRTGGESPIEAVERATLRSPGRRLIKAIAGLTLFGALAYGGFEYWRNTARPIPQDAERMATADPGPPAQKPDVVSSPAPAERPESAPSPEMLVRRELKSVNVRAGASLNQPVIAKLSGGNRIEAVSEEADWVQVRVVIDGKAKSGWVNRTMLER